MAPSRFTYRTYNEAQSDYEHELANALFEIMGGHVHDLEGIVAELNRIGPSPPNLEDWTIEIFRSEIERLGAYTNSIGAPCGSHAANATSERIHG